MEPPIQITRSCPLNAVVERLEESCRMVGHWQVNNHWLTDRTINEMVLLYCVAGSGWLRVGERRYEAGPGDLLFCPAEVNHGYGCPPETGWELWWVHFHGSRAADLCTQAGLTADNPVCRPADISALLGVFDRLLNSLDPADAIAPWRAAGCLHELLLELVRQHGQPVKERRLVDLVDPDCTSLDDLVRRSGYSRYHYCRLFKEETGLSPWQYVLERRIERAKELLLGTRLSVKQISVVLGFNTPDYFARLFARSTGVTPGAYRGRK